MNTQESRSRGYAAALEYAAALHTSMTREAGEIAQMLAQAKRDALAEADRLRDLSGDTAGVEELRARVDQLLAANNAEVERRREAEASLRKAQASLDAERGAFAQEVERLRTDRDAMRHRTLGRFQSRINAIAARAFPDDVHAERRILKDQLIARLAGEMGELAGATQSFEGRPLSPEKRATPSDIEMEIGDCLILLARIASTYRLSFYDCALQAEQKFRERASIVGTLAAACSGLREQIGKLVKQTAGLVADAVQQMDPAVLGEVEKCSKR